MATKVVRIIPPYPLKPADCMSSPPATAPHMPIAMSIIGPYVFPLRIFPPNQPATNPKTIHDEKYINSQSELSNNSLQSCPSVEQNSRCFKLPRQPRSCRTLGS